MLDSPYLTKLTRSVLSKQNAILYAALESGKPISTPTEVAFICFVDEKVLPIASIVARRMALQEAGSVTSISENLPGTPLHVLRDMLFTNSIQAQNMLGQQPRLN